MNLASGLGGVAAALAVVAPAAAVDLTYLTQFRAVEVETSFNNNVQTVTAPGFGPFIENLGISTTFPTAGGGAAINRAEAGIDCQLDPNAIRVIGSLAAAGGLAVVGGQPSLEFGEAAAEVETVFRLETASDFLMLASPRPSTRPGDRFQIKLENLNTHQVLFELDETMPPQEVNFSGTLPPGVYELEYEVEMTIDGPESLRNFHFHFLLPGAATCPANCDGSTTAPFLNVNDFLCFQTLFAQGSPRANCDLSTTPPVLSVNDFICFQSRFAAGCSEP